MTTGSVVRLDDSRSIYTPKMAAATAGVGSVPSATSPKLAAKTPVSTVPLSVHDRVRSFSVLRCHALLFHAVWFDRLVDVGFVLEIQQQQPFILCRRI